jgi:hypothetical protein
MSNQQTMTELIKAFSGQANVLSIPKIYIDYMSSLDGGLFLSQVIYWSDKGALGDGWFYKSYAEWTEETTLSKYEVGKQAKILIDRGVLETKIKKADGAPTVHYHFLFDEFQKSINEFLSIGKSRNLTNESEKTERSITETTTETTTETLQNGKNPLPPVVEAIRENEIERKKALNALADSIASTCQVNIDLAAPRTREAIKSLTVKLSGEQVTPDDLKKFTAWWYDNTWQGKKGQPPTPAQIGDSWGQFEAQKVINVPQIETDGGFYI